MELNIAHRLVASYCATQTKEKQMNVFKITSEAAEKQEGWPQGMRTIYSYRRSPEAVARHETTAAEKKTRVCVEQLTGSGKGTFWAGTPCEYWPRKKS